ncbi:MAG: phosphate ABC transporter substrate-binding protein PstS [Acidobacteria bacterium]|nr:phosphate ABC transporter substrate-binding protein PstS [Acidobacteriota bacterium]
MKITRSGSIAAVALVGALALAGCSASTTSTTTSSAAPTSKVGLNAIDPSLTGTITAAGSSAQVAAQTGYSAAFSSVATGVTLNYNPEGSGGGRKDFIAGSLDFAGSDAPLSAAETTQAAATFPGGALDIPVYLDGVAIQYNEKDASTLNLSGSTLAKIFAGKITNWSDPAIATDNGGKALPSKKITVVTRSDSSGTMQNLTNYLAGAAGSDWPAGPNLGTLPQITGMDLQKGGAAVATEIAAVDGAIGGVDHSALTSGATVASVDGVKLTNAGIAEAMATGFAIKPNSTPGDLSGAFDYTKIKADTKAYPIPLLSYDIIPATFKDAAKKKLVLAYLEFIASTDGQKAGATKANSVQLPDSILKQVTATLATVK